MIDFLSKKETKFLCYKKLTAAGIVVALNGGDGSSQHAYESALVRRNVLLVKNSVTCFSPTLFCFLCLLHYRLLSFTLKLVTKIILKLVVVCAMNKNV